MTCGVPHIILFHVFRSNPERTVDSSVEAQEVMASDATKAAHQVASDDGMADWPEDRRGYYYVVDSYDGTVTWFDLGRKGSGSRWIIP